MQISGIGNFNPSMKCFIKAPQKVKMAPTIRTYEKEYTLDFNKEKGIIRMTSNIPNAMDAISWYTLNKNGEATFQSCWQIESVKTKSIKLKKLYDDIVKETQNGTKELSQERQKEIVDLIFKKANKK